MIQLLPGTRQGRQGRFPRVTHLGTLPNVSQGVSERLRGTSEVLKTLRKRIEAFNPDEARDERGRWTEGGAGYEAYKQTRDAVRAPALARMRELEAAVPFEKMNDAQREEYFAASDVGRKAERDWDRSVREALSEGRLSLVDAKARGFYPSGHDSDNDGYPIDREGHKGGWQKLPYDLYHVTTAKDAVQAEGLKTRVQLQQESGKGLGGGDDSTISFTTDEEGAHNIYHSMVEAQRVASGELSVADLLKAAQEGRSAKRPFDTEIMQQWKPEWKRGDPLPQPMVDLLEGKETESTGLGKTVAELPAGAEPGGYHWTGGDGQERYGAYRLALTPDQLQNQRFDFYKTFLWMRESAGGPENPLFFGTDVKGLAAVPKDQIAIVEASPRHGAQGWAQGYPMSAMKEWRTHSGKAVRITGFQQPSPEIRAAIDDLAMLRRRVSTACLPVALLAMGSGVQAYSPDQPRDEKGRWSDGGPGGEIFVSPNVKENLTFEEAVKALGSDRQRQIRHTAENLLRNSSREYRVSNAIGDWSDGAENSLFIQADVKDPAKVAFLASKLGMAAQQKAVIAFSAAEGGKDSVWHIRVRGTDLNRTRSVLESNGVHFRTLVPHRGDTVVHVFDEGSAMQAQMQKVAYALQGRLTVERGSGEFIGGNSRDEGLARYRERIDRFQRSGAGITGRGTDSGHHFKGDGGRSARFDRDRTAGVAAEFNPDEPRDETGKWTSGGGGSAVPGGKSGSNGTPGLLPTTTAPRAGADKNVQSIADEYNAQRSGSKIDHTLYPEVDQARGRRIADAYEALQPFNKSPEVAKAYQALSDEIRQQWDFAVAHGIKFEPWRLDGQPYATSTEMMKDVADNKHLYFYTGGEPHPLLSKIDRDTGLTRNDEFRAVHDLFGHAAGGFGFGARGEEAAFLAHSQMFGDEAKKAMATETRGQNSWVNFGRHNYGPDGKYLNIPPASRPYAEQKVDLLPDEFLPVPSDKSKAVVHALRVRIARTLAAYSPDEARDDHGKWTKDGDSDKSRKGSTQGTFHLYHGTSSALIAQIEKEGFVAGKGKGGDAWAKQHNFALSNAELEAEGVKRSASVYLTSEASVAVHYANLASSNYKGSHPVIFDLAPPKEARGKFVPDELDPAAVRYVGKIPPSWIVKTIDAPIEHVTVRNDEIHITAKASGHIYVVFLVQSGKMQAYSPDQARDDDGRWTDGGGTEKALNVMYLKAPLAKQSIDGLARAVAVQIDGAQVMVTSLKSKERALQKINSDYGGDAARIKDLARNTLVVPGGREEDALTALLKEVPEIDPATMVKRTDPAKDPLGYSMIAVTVPTDSGVRGEIQILSPEMIAAKMPKTSAVKLLGEDKFSSIAQFHGTCCQGHRYYERWRNLPPDSMAAQQIAARSRAYYAGYRRRSVTLRGEGKHVREARDGRKTLSGRGRLSGLPVRTGDVQMGKGQGKRKAVRKVLRDS